MNSKLTAMAIGVVAVLVAGCFWWVLSATPGQAAIEAARRPATPVPRINLQLLDGSLTGTKTTNGTLPVPVNQDALGRDDPFAGV